MLNSSTHSSQALWNCAVQAILFVALLMAAVPSSRAEDNKWGISPYAGLYAPKLSDLNKGEFKAPYEGDADIINEAGNNTQDTFVYDSPLPELGPGSLAGLEFQLKLNDRHTFTFGGASWESTSTASSRGLIPIQGNFESLAAQRQVDLSYLEYYLGWRYNVFVTPQKKFRLYATGSLHQIYDIDYEEYITMVFTTGPARTFRKSVSQSAQGTGLSLIQGSAGAEYFISDSFSISLEGGYTFGLKEVELYDSVISSDILATDSLRLQLPMLPSLDDQRLSYKTEPGQAREDYKKLKLDFDGWRALIKATLYF